MGRRFAITCDRCGKECNRLNCTILTRPIRVVADILVEEETILCKECEKDFDNIFLRKRTCGTCKYDCNYDFEFQSPSVCDVCVRSKDGKYPMWEPKEDKEK